MRPGDESRGRPIFCHVKVSRSAGVSCANTPNRRSHLPPTFAAFGRRRTGAAGSVSVFT
jgi:hypothetical protein